MKDLSLPAYKEYVKGVGIHGYQLMEKGEEHNNWYAFIYKDGKLDRSYQSNCFSGMSATSTRMNKMDYILLQVQTKFAEQIGTTDKDMHLYYEWLFNYSNLRHAFVNKDAGVVLKDRVVVLDPDQDARIVICAANAVRMMWEIFSGDSYQIAQKIKIWCQLVNMGVDPTVAFPLCHSMIKTSKGYKVTPYIHGNGHEFIRPSEQDHINFIESNLSLENQSFNELGGFSGFGALYRKEDISAAKKFDMLSFVKDRWTEEKKDNNPFSSSSSMSLAILKPDEFLSKLKEISTDYVNELKGRKINVV